MVFEMNKEPSMCLSLACAVAGLAAPATVTGPAMADPITLKFSHFLGPTSFFQVDVVEPWAKELEAKTNGQVKVEIFNASSPLGTRTAVSGARRARRLARAVEPLRR